MEGKGKRMKQLDFSLELWHAGRKKVDNVPGKYMLSSFLQQSKYTIPEVDNKNDAVSADYQCNSKAKVVRSASVIIVFVIYALKQLLWRGQL